MAQQEQTTKPASTQRRSETAGLFHFGKEMVSALLMAFIAIIYVIQAFRIPTGSMEDSLLIGDFLLGIKCMYGAPVVPFSYAKFPGFKSPKPGDVIIFEYPGSDGKDYIKRCVAGPGQTIEMHGKKLIVDGKEVALPPGGKYIYNASHPYISDFPALRIPKKGDVIYPDSLPVREFMFLKNLMIQEHPNNRFGKFIRTAPVLGPIFSRSPGLQKLFGMNPPGLSSHVRTALQLYINGEYANDKPIPIQGYGPGGMFTFDRINQDPRMNAAALWIELDAFIKQVTEMAQAGLPGQEVSVRKVIYLDNKIVKEYKVKYDNYFMMGDNRDNSTDSRFWGYLNRNYVKAQAFIIYFSWNSYKWCPQCHSYRAPNGDNYSASDGRGPSLCANCNSLLDKSVPFYLKIRWDRIGKLIRPWTGAQNR